MIAKTRKNKNAIKRALAISPIARNKLEIATFNP